MFITARSHLASAISKAIQLGFNLPASESLKFISLKRCAKAIFGDLSSSAPAKLASHLKLPSDAVAREINTRLSLDDSYISAQEYRNGFINFIVSTEYTAKVLQKLIEAFMHSPSESPHPKLSNCASLLNSSIVSKYNLKLLADTRKAQEQDLGILKRIALCHDDLYSFDPDSFKRSSALQLYDYYSDYYRTCPIITDDHSLTLLRLQISGAVMEIQKRVP